MRVWRVFGGGANQTGRYFTSAPQATSAAAQRALQLPTENAATFMVEAVIPRGTTIYQGVVAGSPSGATQIFVSNPGVVQFGTAAALP